MCSPRVSRHTLIISRFKNKKKKLFQFSCGCEQFYYGTSFGFLVINVCKHREHYETSCIIILQCTVHKTNHVYLNVYKPEVLLVQKKAGWDAYDKRCGCKQQLQQTAQLSLYMYIYKRTFLLKLLSLCTLFFTHCSTQNALQ
jgi:hypothetical protein